MMACLVMSVVSCRETIESIFGDDIAEGDEVMFTTSLPSVAVTRSDKDDYQKAMDAYQAVSEAYEFTIGMYQKGITDSIGTAVYQPSTDGNLVLKDGQTSLYWPSTTVAYGFKAIAGTNTIEADQSTKDNLLAQDHLEGYGYIQKWDDTNSAPIDKLDELNYRTAKQWKALNREVKLVSNEDDYKRIPLYLQHKRSLITIVLKAGEGVSREALAYAVAKNDLSARIYSYHPDSLGITPLASEEKINYDADKNGDAASDVSTTRYDAIVEPCDYSENNGDKLIAKVSLSGQNYSFYAGNV